MRLCVIVLVVCCSLGVTCGASPGKLPEFIEQLEKLTQAKIASSQVQRAAATCNVMPNPSLLPSDPLYQDIRGTVSFNQQEADGPVDVDISLTGFSTSDALTTHGFHVHQSGDIAAGCEGAEGHFNPNGNKHGAPSDTNRHVGDLGNIEENASGGVTETKVDDVISFDGTNNITGRAIVIHETFDDLGLGNYSDSNTTGHAGARLACCVITTVSGQAGSAGNGAAPLVGGLLTSFMVLLAALHLLRLQ